MCNLLCFRYALLKNSNAGCLHLLAFSVYITKSLGCLRFIKKHCNNLLKLTSVPFHNYTYMLCFEYKSVV